MTYSLQELLLSLSLAAYLTVCVVVAVVRWKHKCNPYARHEDYYFPAWRTLVFCALSNLSLCPVLVMPGESDALLQLRLVLLMASPFLCSVLIFSYFGRVLKLTWWRKPTLWMSVSYALVSAVALVVTLLPGTQMQGPLRSWFFLTAGLLTALYLLGLIFALSMILQPLGRFSEENFSNPDDFPQQYAKSIIYLPFLHLLMSWSATFNGQLPVMSFALVILSVLSVIILLGALSPHRALEVERLEAELEAEQKARQQEPELLPTERKDEILQAIRLRVEKEQAYLDSHLTLSKLSQLCGFNRTYVSSVLNETLGGFFFYVNHCRLLHAEAYKADHPGADMDEVALVSGFNSRQSYYNARKKR